MSAVTYAKNDAVCEKYVRAHIIANSNDANDQAIKYAINNASEGDIIVRAGKGHETYQILKTGKIHLDEREVVKEALKKCGGI